MSDQDWDWVNWYATRRHLLSPDQDYRGKRWSWCGRTDVETFEQHAKHRARWTDKPKDYGAIPRCKSCERKAAKA